MQKTRVQSLVGKIPQRREWLPTPVFLPKESHGQKSLVGYSPRGHKESDTAEQLTLSLSRGAIMQKRKEKKRKKDPVLLDSKSLYKL